MGEKNTVDKPSDWKLLQLAAQRAKIRSEVARWNMEIAVFLFSVFVAIVILLFNGARVEFVAAIAILGFAIVWFEGWRRGKNLYKIFLNDELSKIGQHSQKIEEEKIEEEIEKALLKKVRQ